MRYTRSLYVQPVAFEVSFLLSQIPISNLNLLGVFCHVSLKRDPGDWDWKLRLNDTPNTIAVHSLVDTLMSYTLSLVVYLSYTLI